MSLKSAALPRDIICIGVAGVYFIRGDTPEFIHGDLGVTFRGNKS